MDTGEAALEAQHDFEGGHKLQQRQRQSRLQASGTVNGAGRASNTERGQEDERTGLLEGERVPQEQDRRTSWSDDTDFDHLPWYRRPHILWVVIPYFFLATAFGGLFTPKVNLIVELVCREYMSERSQADPGFVLIPVDFNNGNNDQCRIPQVQRQASVLILWGGVITGILSAISSPKLGALSDRYGRKAILVVSSLGTICSEIVTIFAALYPETFPVPLILLGFALDGLTGSLILALSMSSAYATDCTNARTRSLAFGYLHACLFTGIALGPFLAGVVVKWSGRIVTVFYIAIGVHVVFVLFVGLVVPESLSERRREEARKKAVLEALQTGPEWDLVNTIRSINIFEPLKILHPTGPGTSAALRRNLYVLAAVDTIVFGVAMGAMAVLVLYLNLQFGWGTYETGIYQSIVNSSRVVTLVLVLPLVTRLFRRSVSGDKGCDSFDLALIRLAVFFDTLGFLGFTLARTGEVFTLSGVVTALGGIGSPSLQSALTKHIPPERTGQLLGALGLLHALARIVAPAVFGAIYSVTVGSFPQAVFVCLFATFFFAVLISFLIRPHVHYDDGPEEEQETVAA